MKTAHNVRRIGLALAKGEHLIAANELPPPSDMKRWKDKNWTYTPASDTDIRRLFAKVRRELKKQPK